MRTPVGMVRKVMYLIFTLMISVALAACGGGGGGTTSSGGPASASVSVASAPDGYPAETTSAVATASPAGTSDPSASTLFDHVWVTVTKVALIPSTGMESPNTQDGEHEEEGHSGGPGFVTAELPSPVVFDLLHPPTGGQVAKLLNRFPDIPAGEYSKIRVYYDNVVGVKGDNTVTFHQTANYHFDVHFVGGNLIVPVATNPDGGIRFYEIRIQVVGLKIHEAGNSDKFLLRPQVFATVDTVKYLVSGVAQNVTPVDNTFNIITSGGTTLKAAYNAATDCIYSDNTVDPVRKSSSAGDVLGASGLKNGAIVDVIGTFSSDNVLLAKEVDITFPDVLTGKVSVGWKSDNTFDLRILAGDNTVFPMPARTTAYYDNAVDSARLSDTNISDNAAIIARGYYKVTGGINAYWISIGP